MSTLLARRRRRGASTRSAAWIKNRTFDGVSAFYDTATNYVYISEVSGTGGGAGTKENPLDALPGTLVADTVYVLKGGETYTGGISMTQNGTSGNRIVIDGNSAGDFGTGKAIVDVSTVFGSWVSAGTLNGNAVWERAAPTGHSSPQTYVVRQAGQRMSLAQDVGRGTDDPLYERHDIDNFHTGSGSQADFENNNEVTSTVFEGLSESPVGASVYLWVVPNVVTLREITAYVDNGNGTGTITFDGAAASINTGGAAGGTFAVANHPDCVTLQGEYIIRSGNIKAYPFSDPTITIPQLNDTNSRAAYMSGDYCTLQHVSLRGADLSGIEVENAEQFKLVSVDVKDCSAGVDHPLQLRNADHGEVIGCQVYDSVFGFGIYVDSCENVRVDQNIIEKCNRTGIYVTGGTTVPANGSKDVWLRGNYIGDRIGVHGNGIAIYDNLGGMRVIDNYVWMPKGGICFAHLGTPHLQIIGNVFASGVSDSAGQLLEIRNEADGAGYHTVAGNTLWVTESGNEGDALSIIGEFTREGVRVIGNLGDGIATETTNGSITIEDYRDNGFTANSGSLLSDAALVSAGQVNLKSSRDAMFINAAAGDFRLTSAGKTAVDGIVSPSITVAGVTVDWMGAYRPSDNTNPFNAWKDDRAYGGVGTVPALSSSTPADGATGVAVDGAIALTFDATVEAGSGFFELYNVTSSQTIEKFNVGSLVGDDGGTIGFSGAVVTLTPGNDLPGSTNVAVKWTTSAAVSTSGVGVAENTSNTTLDFTTEAVALSNPIIHAKTTFSLGTGASTETKTLPGTPAEDDLVIVARCHDGIINDDLITTSGYSNVYNNGAAFAPGVDVQRKIMGATPDSDVEIEQDSTRNQVGVIIVVRGANTTTPIHVQSDDQGGSGLPDPPQVTTTIDDTLGLIFGFLDDDVVSSAGAPSGYTDFLSLNSAGPGGERATIYFAAQVYSTADTYNPGAFTGDGDDEWEAVTLAIAPA